MAILSVKHEVPEYFKLRAQDAMECTGFGLTPEQGVHRSIELSDTWESYYLDDSFAAVWGYARANLFSAQCFVWLLTTDAVTEHRTLFARQSIKNCRKLFKMFHELQAIVHQDYDLSLDWLMWLGFKPVTDFGDYIMVRCTKEDFQWLS